MSDMTDTAAPLFNLSHGLPGESPKPFPTYPAYLAGTSPHLPHKSTSAPTGLPTT